MTEQSNMLKKMKEEGLCCVTGKPLKDCKYLNFIHVHRKAQWPFPIWGNVITGHQNMACAYVHDECIENNKLKGEVINAVEFKDGEIIYHPVADLENFIPPVHPFHHLFQLTSLS